jgi:hypothetical protein
VLPVSGTSIIEMSSMIDEAGEFALLATVTLPKHRRTVAEPEGLAP